MSNERVRIERTYEAPIEDVWALWTTRDGFESWWGPVGFRVDVHEIDARAGGALSYDMIAVGADEIAFMKQAGMPLAHATRGTFVEVMPLERLEIMHVIDFIPGLGAYQNRISVELASAGKGVRMVVLIERHPDDAWTQRAVAGFESQLEKVPAALARRRAKLA